MRHSFTRTVTVVAALTSLLLLATVTFASTPANAAYIHQFSSYFGSFENPESLAVDQSTNDLYVLEPSLFISSEEYAEACLQRFDSHQAPADFSALGSNRICGFYLNPGTSHAQVAIDNSGTATDGTIYVTTQEIRANNHHFGVQAIRAYQPSGELIGEILPPQAETLDICGVATDPHGNLYVANDSAANIYVYRHDNPITAADLIRKISFFGKEDTCQLAADSSEAIYAQTFSQNQPYGSLNKYQPNSSARALFDPKSSAPYVDPLSDEVYVDEGDQIAVFDSSGNLKERFGKGDLTVSLKEPYDSHAVAVDHSTGVAYASDTVKGRIAVFTPAVVPDVTLGQSTNLTPTSATLNAHLDPAGGGPVTVCRLEYGTTTEYGSGSLPCETEPPSALPYSATAPTDVHVDLSGLTPETTYDYRFVVGNAEGSISAAATVTPHHVVGLTTDPATGISPTTAALNASFLGNGEDTRYFFEWGTDTSYGHTTAAPPGDDAGAPPPGPQRVPLSATLQGLKSVTTYHYRVIAENSDGISVGEDQSFRTLPFAPTIEESVSDVHGDSAILHAQINPGGGDTKYHFEYGSSNCSSVPDPCASQPAVDADIGSGTVSQGVSVQLQGLSAGTTYHYRVLATNADSPPGGTPGPDRTFTTFPFTPLLNDPCPNAHVRQQTGAAQLPDCRAYELVSAADTGGYDVESSLSPGQAPFAGYPEADARLLYGVHDGAIPGIGQPTNKGVDPYLAVRGEAGWSTRYVGIPADGTPSTGSFSSTLLGADAKLETFAFGGPEICSPCFADGSTGNPIHLPNGELVQGDAGSIAKPSAEPAGFIGKHFSADGTHFIFGSKAKLEPDANENSAVNVYDRNLTTEETHVVSKTPGGENMTGPGIGELDISKDGSRIVIGQLVSEEGEAKYWHLYMNVGDGGKTIDLTPGTTHGVLFDGMTADGSKVFFTTVDRLLPTEDTDHSADIYMAEVSGSSATLKLISTGTEGTGNTDECDPVANSAHEHWNTVAPEEESCGVVAIGGGGGVASGDGSVYFLSPEKLDGSSHGVQNAPNLYLARPEATPHFIATLESVLTGPQPPTLTHTFDHNFGAFADVSGLAVDHSSGDIYTLDLGANVVEKFDSAGNLITSFGDTAPAPDGHLSGSATPAGSFAELSGLNIPTQLAVDQSNGDLYVPDLFHGTVDKFDSSGTYIPGFSIGIGFPTGVAVSPSDGTVYVSSYFGKVGVFKSSGQEISTIPVSGNPTGVAVGPDGTLYVAGSSGTVVVDAVGKVVRTLDPNPSQSVTVDPSNGDVYVDEGTQVVQFSSSGQRLRALGEGHLTGSVGVAVDPRGNLYASNSAGAAVAVFPPSLAPSSLIDNPAVLHGVSDASRRYTADFQLTPNGNDAVFTSTLPLTGYDNAGHTEVYRYDSASDRLDCVSCAPTGAQATGDASLASDGLSISDDGRVFFNSTDALTPRDLDNKKDVYEWEAQGFKPGFGLPPCQTAGGCLGLISTGISSFDSALLSASNDGADVYFFTHDALVPQDQNGQLVKIYDARAGGGFLFIPKPVPCQASDECHGPSSQPPPPPAINTVRGGDGNQACKPGFIVKHARCVKRHRTPRHHHGRSDRGRAGHRNRGSGK